MQRIERPKPVLLHISYCSHYSEQNRQTVVTGRNVDTGCTAERCIPDTFACLYGVLACKQQAKNEIRHEIEGSK